MSSKRSSRPDDTGEVVAVDHGSVDPEVVHKASSALQSGAIVAMRTDTVYGLLASVNRRDALGRLREMKSRNADKPFVLLAADWIGVRAVSSWIPSVARFLASRYWPGPLTLVLPARGDLPEEIATRASTVAIRIPGDPLVRAVIRELRCPVAAPSANRSGQEPAASAEEILSTFPGQVDLLLDGGPVTGGMPSTLVDCSTRHAKVLREGPVVLSADEIAAR